jgi:hypothetical protein
VFVLVPWNGGEFGFEGEKNSTAGVNLPIVELCVCEPFLGLHGHVQDAGGTFGRHDDLTIAL